MASLLNAFGFTYFVAYPKVLMDTFTYYFFIPFSFLCVSLCDPYPVDLMYSLLSANPLPLHSPTPNPFKRTYPPHLMPPLWFPYRILMSPLTRTLIRLLIFPRGGGPSLVTLTLLAQLAACQDFRSRNIMVDYIDWLRALKHIKGRSRA